MKNIILFKSNNGNAYFYNAFTNFFYYVDEITFILIEALLHGMELTDMNINNLLNKNKIKLDINKYEYYKQKIKNYTLREDELFFLSEIKTEITEEDIKYRLSNNPHITFEVTENCNLDCKYCVYGGLYKGYKPRKSNDLDIEAAKLMVKYIYDYCISNYKYSNNNTITISFYGGEPLLRFDFIKNITLFAKELESDTVLFKFNMTTNATLLNNYMDFLQKYNFNLLISLDGNFENNSYRTYKNGKESFTTVYKNIINLKKLFPQYFCNNVAFNCVLHNKNSVKEIKVFIKKNFDKNPFISEISSEMIIEEHKLEFIKIYKNKSDDLKKSENYFKLINKYDITEVPEFSRVLYLIFNLSNLVYSNYKDIYSELNNSIKPTDTCYPFSRRIFVTASGKILPCEKVPHHFIFGMVTIDGINIDFNNIIQMYNKQLKKMLNDVCNNCYNIINCHQCMYFLNLNDDIANCHGFMNKKEFSENLSEIFTIFENNPELFKKIMHEISLS